MKNFILLILFGLISNHTFSQITLSVTSTPVSCFGGSNGSATVTASGGSGPYSYTWQPTGYNGDIITGLGAGQYTVIVMDASSNTATAIATINEPQALMVAIVSTTMVSCNSMCDGAAQAIVDGGTPLYSFIWSPSMQIGSDATNLCAGTHTLTVNDANGCVVTSTATITEPPPINITITTTNAACNGSCSGTASTMVSGGVPAYSFLWSNGSTTPNLNNICAGSYTIQVTDSKNCSQYVIAYINNIGTSTIPNTSITINAINETCYLSGDGAIDLNITGSNPGPFTYAWSNGATTQDIVNVVSNVYWVNITDAASNCMTLTDTIFSTGTNCGTISGNIFVDANSDCIKNSGDINLNNITVIVNPGNHLGYTNSLGNYSVGDLPYGTYSVAATSNNVNLTPACTTIITTSISGGNPNSINNNFAFSSLNPTQPDMYASAYTNGIVPGFLCHVNYNLINQAYYNGSGIFKAQLPSSMIANFSSASPNTYTITGDTIMWDFSNIAYNTSNYFTVNFTVPVNTPLGSTFNTCWWIQTSTPDFYPQNNTGCYQRLVTGSFDPNDKSVSPVGVGANGSILASETDLTYLIRFQNTGNGPAHFIVVRDTLSPNLDVASLKMLSASHNYNLEILPGNILKWRFDNIMLPDSGSNEAGSHGYIQYAIKRNGNNNPGTEIKNTAYIYFDFNEPFITNTTLNTIMAPTFVSSSNKNDNSWLVYPNPNNGILYISNSTSENKEIEIQITNAIGDVVYQGITSQQTKTLDLNKHSNGVYFIKLTSDKQTSIQRIVLSK